MRAPAAADSDPSASLGMTWWGDDWVRGKDGGGGGQACRLWVMVMRVLPRQCSWVPASAGKTKKGVASFSVLRGGASCMCPAHTQRVRYDAVSAVRRRGFARVFVDSAGAAGSRLRSLGFARDDMVW